MSRKVRVELNRPGVRALMQSATMQQVLDGYASRVLAACPEGFAKSTHVGPTRANVQVSAETKEAYFRNLHTNVLLKALGGAHD